MSYEIIKGRYAISHKYTDDRNQEQTAIIYLTFESSNNVTPRSFDGHIIAIRDDSWRNSLPTELYSYAECCDNGSVKLYNGNTTSEAWISFWKKEQDNPIPYERIGFSFRTSLWLEERYKGKILAEEITGHYAASILHTIETIYKVNIHEPLKHTMHSSHCTIEEVISHFTDDKRHVLKNTGISFCLSVSNYVIERLRTERNRTPYKQKESTAKKVWKPGDRFTNGKANYILLEKSSSTQWLCHLESNPQSRYTITSRTLNKTQPLPKTQAA